MTQGIELMKELGFTTPEIKHETIVRQFIKYDDEGDITDIISYFYSKITGVQVFTNSVKYGYGTRLDRDLLNAVSINFYELEKLLKENEL